MANLTVRLYRALKSGGWRQRPVTNKELPNLKDLPDGEGKFYLSYQQGGRRKMQPVDRQNWGTKWNAREIRAN